MRNKIIIFIIITILIIGGVCVYMFTNKGNDNSKVWYSSFFYVFEKEIQNLLD